MSLAVYESIILTLGVRVPRTLDFNPRVDDSGSSPRPDIEGHLVEDRAQESLVIGDRSHSHDRAPVFVVVTHLGHAEVLPRAEPVAVLGDYATLVLEGSGARNPKTQAQDAHPARLIGCFEQHRLDRADFFLHEGLEHVTDLDVVEALEVHTALVALLDLADVVLEASKTGELARPEDDAVAEQPDLV